MLQRQLELVDESSKTTSADEGKSSGDSKGKSVTSSWTRAKLKRRESKCTWQNQSHYKGNFLCFWLHLSSKSSLYELLLYYYIWIHSLLIYSVYILHYWYVYAWVIRSWKMKAWDVLFGNRKVLTMVGKFTPLKRLLFLHIYIYTLDSKIMLTIFILFFK